MKITIHQRMALTAVQNGYVIAVRTAHKLRQAGLVEKDGRSGQNGYSKVRLTDVGRKALAET